MSRNGRTHLKLRGVYGDGLVALVFGERRVFGGREGGNDLDGGLDASHEWRDEDAVDWKPETRSELGTGAEGPDLALFDQRRVPRPRRLRCPEGLEVVDAVAVAHDDDVLEAVVRGPIGGFADRFGLTFVRVHFGEILRERSKTDGSRVGRNKKSFSCEWLS